MDVSEVDVALQFQGSLDGSLNLPQARGAGSSYVGHDYLVGGTLQYLQTPTIRYIPLAGQALVAQISQTISVDSLAAMIDSQWPVSAVFDFAVTRLTPVDKDYYEALDAIIYLSDHNALDIVPARADPGSSGANDTLKLYFLIGEIRKNDVYKAVDPNARKRAEALWQRLWDIYGPSQPVDIQKRDYCIELRTKPRLPQVDKNVLEASADNDATQPAKPAIKNAAELGQKEGATLATTDSATVQPTDENKYYNIDADEVSSSLPKSKYPPYLRPYQLMPTLRIHSALGILREITQPDLGWDLVAFIQTDHREQEDQIELERVHAMIEKFNKDFPKGRGRDYYVFDSSKLTGHTIPPPTQADSAQAEYPWQPMPSARTSTQPADDLPPTSTTRLYTSIQDYYEENGYPECGNRWRHYMIVFYQDARRSLPSNAYVSAICDGKCFYIDGDDIISQRNFGLVCHFLTIQAVPQSPQLIPTIGVGGATH
jgi:hypothetical protein